MKKKAGRPRATLTDEQAAQLEALAAYFTEQQIADYFGMARRTLQNIFEREPNIYARYKKGKAKAIGAVAQSLIKKARDGDTTCMIFYLKTQAGWKEKRSDGGGDVSANGEWEIIITKPKDA